MSAAASEALKLQALHSQLAEVTAANARLRGSVLGPPPYPLSALSALLPDLPRPGPPSLQAVDPASLEHEFVARLFRGEGLEPGRAPAGGDPEDLDLAARTTLARVERVENSGAFAAYASLRGRVARENGGAAGELWAWHGTGRVPPRVVWASPTGLRPRAGLEHASKCGGSASTYVSLLGPAVYTGEFSGLAHHFRHTTSTGWNQARC